MRHDGYAAMLGLMWFYRMLVAAAAGAVVYDFYAVTRLDELAFGAQVYWVVLALVLLEPLVLAAMHLIGGLLMGLASGGLLDGLKLAVIIGTGRAVGRLWLTVLAGAAGVFAASGPLLYSGGGLVLALLLLGLDVAISWFWRQAKPELGMG